MYKKKKKEERKNQYLDKSLAIGMRENAWRRTSIKEKNFFLLSFISFLRYLARPASIRTTMGSAGI